MEQHKTSSRDHCNKCLYGQHIDINPGDRLNDCKGELLPVGIRKNKGREQIVYDCEKCGERVYCITAQDDNKDLLIELSTRTWTFQKP